MGAEEINIVGYVLVILIGFTLGLIGGGGSMLAVPVLVYFFNYPAEQATGYSLLIVGLTSFIGSYSCIRYGEFAVEALYLFALPSLVSIFCTRKFLMPSLPEHLFDIGDFHLTKDLSILVVFSVVILFASVAMIARKSQADRNDLMWAEFFKGPLKIPFIVLLGLLVGFISGFVGAGGGFMIIPVLVIFLRLPMKKAIGTSLLIIAVNSLVGFTGNIGQMNIEWKFLAVVCGLAIAGIFAGRYLSNYISGRKLRSAFGWFSLIVGISILVKEFLFINSNKQ